MTYPPYDPNQPQQPPLPPPGYYQPPPPPQIIMVQMRRPFPWYWHLFHFTGTVLTCGLWGIVYAIHYGAHKKANTPNPYHY